jgi:DNA-binding LacI/PurR family transcriptional regulator
VTPGGNTAGEAPARRRTHPTILDVADRAGVSKSLVSLVMRNSPRVSEAKRAAVLRAADELHYRPNAVARSLVRQRSFLIGVMLSDLHNPFFVEVVDGIEQEAMAAKYHALFNTGGRTAEGEAAAIETLLQLRTDGLILAGPMITSREILAAAATTRVVLVARPSRWREVDSVTNDDRVGARLAVEHLIGLGHRSIAHIDGGKGAGAGARRSGYLEAMRRNGLGGEANVVRGAFTEQGGAGGVVQLIESRPHPTAVFAANDLAAFGALQALAQNGLRVPDDVSLVGYDNIRPGALGSSNLTTIDQPRREMGATAVTLLLDRLDRKRVRGRHVTVPPSLVVRSSTAPPPADPSRRDAISRSY